MKTPFDITVASSSWEPQSRWHAAIAAALGACAREDGARWPDREISVLLCDDAAIRTLNRQWRGQDKPTNVLSFPTPDEAPSDTPLGDIAIAYETVAREAAEEGKLLDHHFIHLTVHGTLHLLGFDHETEAEAEEMEATERRILHTLGIADPYANADLPERSLT